MDDGRQILMYTGVQSTKDEDGKEIVFQTQCIAVGDGTNFEKYEKNPVITADALPEGASKLISVTRNLERKRWNISLCSWKQTGRWKWTDLII